jgi:diguanylate cyclase (GGDEF)-like protein
MIDLPPPPRRTALVLEGTGPGATLDKLSELLRSEPALSSELLRAGNSHFFNEGMPAKTVERLSMLLGLRTMRALVTCLGVREAFQDLPFEATGDFWADALRRATIAWRLARISGRCEPADALTAAMMLDVGVLALVARDPESLGAWKRLRGSRPSDRPEQELAIAGTTFNVLSTRLLQTWGLAPDVIEAIKMFHSPTSALAELLRAADLLATVYTSRDTQRALQQARQHLQAQWSINNESVDTLLRRGPADAQSAAAAFGLRIGRQPSWRDILQQATSSPDTAKMAPPELAALLEQAARERDSLAFQLQRALDQLERSTSYDPLTGLANQRRLEEALLRELPRLGLKSYCLTLLMSDVDELRLVNDRHGHALGDVVLKGVADALLRGTRASDIQGRLWGGTMVVALPNCTQQDAMSVIQRIRTQLREQTFTFGEARARPTVSMTALSVEGPLTIAEGQEGSYLRSQLGRLHQELQRSKEKAAGEVHWVPQVERWSLSEWWRKL